MKNKNEVVDKILSRRTVRSYDDTPLTPPEVMAILDCAMWAPSARNSQHCFVRAITKKEQLEELNKDFKDTVGWDTPAYTRWDVNPVYQTAPALFLIFADEYAPMDAGIMVENMAIAAEGLGLNSCIIGSLGMMFEKSEEMAKKWRTALSIQTPAKFMVSIAVGHGNESPEPKPRQTGNFF